MMIFQNEQKDVLAIKKSLRKQFLTQRKNFYQKGKTRIWEERITARVHDVLSKLDYQSILFYSPHAGEVSLFGILEELLSTKSVLFPRVESGGVMSAIKIYQRSDLVSGYRGILEPKPSLNPPSSPTPLGDGEKLSHLMPIDVILVPGIAFRVASTENGHRLYRLGYGGGYYDRFLLHHFQSWKIGIFFEFQKTEIDCFESHDMVLDRILTEEGDYVTESV